MDSYENDFGKYQKGEDDIDSIYDTPDEFAKAMREWIKK